ncbi:high chlorophyll fluorescence 153 [Striga asiatica]|uniref:High chlorophyll fluorescence 153 n=1 Tax=Striga asiatica TaxID=4170 RepID=A0A5A7QF51_STRAF|nr:high chlorophyll fluorescence 153 [Striga asiatica]
MMVLCNSLSTFAIPRLIPTADKQPTTQTPVKGRTIGPILQVSRRKASPRGISVVTRAGPSASSYIFAFVFPLSLLAVTIITSARIADKLDQKFFEELAINQAILEGEEENEDEISVPLEKEAKQTRSRNRPKREVERSSST